MKASTISLQSGALNGRQTKSARRMPFFVYFIVISTFLACTLGDSISLAGFSLKGLAWFGSLILASAVVIRSPGLVSFPWILWLPWVVLVALYGAVSSFDNAWQRTVMIICPIMVGAAASTYSVSERDLLGLKSFFGKVTFLFFAFVVLSTGMLITGQLPETTGLAPQVMTGALLAAFFTVRYAIEGAKLWLYYLAGLMFVPFIAMTRMGMLVTALVFPVTLAPLDTRKRVVAIVLLCVLAVGAFYTDRVQKKMFISGQGELTDLDFDNPDLRMSGRKLFWKVLSDEIENAPWLGHGANANEIFLITALGSDARTMHPHSDWLRLRFDYGYIGTAVFAVCLVLQTLQALKRARETTGETRILFYTGASSFVVFAMFMYSDNILLYCQFFGNLQFTILGLAYASYRSAKVEEKRRVRAEGRRRMAEVYAALKAGNRG